MCVPIFKAIHPVIVNDLIFTVQGHTVNIIKRHQRQFPSNILVE